MQLMGLISLTNFQYLCVQVLTLILWVISFEALFFSNLCKQGRILKRVQQPKAKFKKIIILYLLRKFLWLTR